MATKYHKYQRNGGRENRSPAPRSPTPDPRLPVVVNGAYRLTDLLAEGESARTYRAERLIDGLPVVVKAYDPRAVGAAVSEARMLRSARHPSVVEVLDVGRVERADPSPFDAVLVVTRFVEGASLDEWLGAAGADAAAAATELFAQALAATGHLHRRGIVHRDLHPANLRVSGGATDPRVTILDFDLAVRAGTAAVPAGRIGFIAPEQILGRPEPRSDLYSLAASIRRALIGRDHLPPSDWVSLATLALRSDPVPLRDVMPSVPAAFARAIDACLAREPSRRPFSARAALAMLDPARAEDVEAPAPGLHDPPLVGRDAEVWAVAVAAAAALDRARDAPAVVLVEGPDSSGRRSVIREAAARLAEDALLAGRSPPAVVRMTTGAGTQDDAATSLAEALDRAARLHGAPAEGVLLLADITGAGDPATAAARIARLVAEARAVGSARKDPRGFAARVRGGPGGGEARSAEQPPGPSDRPDRAAVAAVVAVAPLPARPGFPAARVPLGPLARDHAATLLGLVLVEPPTAQVVDALLAASGGWPGLLLAEAVARFPDGRPAVGSVARATAPLRSDDEALDEASRRIVLRLSAEPLPLPVDLLGMDDDLSPAPDVLAALHRLQRLGWIERCAAGVALRPGARTAARALVAPADRIALHRRLAGAAAPDRESGLRRAFHRIMSAPAREVPAVVAAERADLADGDDGGTALLLGWRMERRGGTLDARALLDLARAAISAGIYRQARAAIDAARARGLLKGRRANPAWLPVEAALLRRTGDVAGAARILEAVASAGRGRGGAARAAAALDLADIALGAGDIATARRRRRAAGHPPAALEGRAAEIDARLALAEGDIDRAGAAIATAANKAGAAEMHRIDALRGAVLLRAGDADGAEEAFAAALRGAEARGERHAAAVCAANLGSAALEAGRLVEAVQRLRGAALALAALGAERERPAVLLNLANALVRIGDSAGARRATARAAEIAPADVWSGLAGYARSLEADAFRREGRLAAAAAAYREAIERLAGGGDEALRASARIDLAETLAALGEPDAAVRELAAVPNPAPTAPLDVRRLAATLRVTLAEAAAAPPAEAVRQLAESLGRLRRPRDVDVERCALAVLARAAARGGRPQAARIAAARALDIGRAMREEVAPMGFDPLEGDADRRIVEALAAAPEPGRAPPGRSGDPDVRRVLAIHRRLASERTPAALLDAILDSMIEVTGAERGLLLVRRRRTGDLAVRRTRNLAADALAGPDGGTIVPGGCSAPGASPPPGPPRNLAAQPRGSVSLTIAQEVARTGEPLLTTDARADLRFAASRSVHDLGLRSVMALPLIARGRVLGVVYLDHRLREEAFDPASMDLALDLAGHAALALQTARHLRLLRLRRREIERLNSELGRRVEQQEIELSGLRETLSGALPSGEAERFEGIIGRSAPMREMFLRMRRVAETGLPVLILGESGTGKELIARAIWSGGSRRAGPFVTENCAAIPEPLLESILFGHVRGAFTGADRDRPGLFATAHGGTLFLDEIGEMPLPLQPKLLRVIEDGEVRPVGGAVSRKVDVRILAASNRDLGAMVREGTFREDLYYRLAVLTIRAPPLRERPDDLAPLVEHFLRKHGGGRDRRLAPAAMRILAAQRWPGNVRQLENTIVRAIVMAEGDEIGADCVDPGQPAARPGEAAADAAGAAGTDDLDLHGNVEALERRLIARALHAAGGNRTRAAAMLGLSRFGLLKKLRRLEPASAR